MHISLWYIIDIVVNYIIIKEHDILTGEKSFTLPVFALILLSFILGTSEFVIIGILPDIAAGSNDR